MIQCTSCDTWLHRKCINMERETFNQFAKEGVDLYCSQRLGQVASISLRCGSWQSVASQSVTVSYVLARDSIYSSKYA